MIKKVMKVSAVVLVLGLTGCATTGLDEVRATADAAARDAAAAKAAAEAARAAASSAAEAARSAQRIADQALSAATESQACCDANRDRLERMFQSAHGAVDLPEFPWPPPQYSGREVVPRDFLDNPEGDTELFDVDRRLQDALEPNGYYESSYYAVPGGFALVTQMEKFEDDGTSVKGRPRWTLETLRLTSFSFRAYLQALFAAEPGRYRLIVFAVTDVPFASSGEEVTQEEARAWLGGGGDRLPPEIGEFSFDESYECTALIYEFARDSEEGEVYFLEPGSLPGRTHLIAAGIWQELLGR